MAKVIVTNIITKKKYVCKSISDAKDGDEANVIAVFMHREPIIIGDKTYKLKDR